MKLIPDLHYDIRIQGNVQGVSFRIGAMAQAKRLKLRGFVKNLDSGEVYLELEGEENKIAEMIEWCRTGPPRSEVISLEAVEGKLKHFHTFELIR